MRRVRPMLASACALGAMYLAFAVGAPWLLREAPPDTYAVVATQAECAGTAHAHTDCAAAKH